MPNKTLIIGDGDLTFTLDLVSLYNQSPSNHITATTYNDLSSLKETYPSLESTINRLNQASNPGKKKRKRGVHPVSLKLIGGINALDLPESIRGGGWTDVIFNHPHLGVEDSGRHQRFVHHLLSSLSGFKIYLTFGIGQVERWGVIEAAERVGVDVGGRWDFWGVGGVENPQYRRRRGHVGGGFGVGGGRSETIGFGLGGDVRPTWAKSEKGGNRWQCSCGRDFETEKSLVDHLRDSSCGVAEEGDFSCGKCEKEFKTEEARNMHVVQVHRGVNGGSIKPDWYLREKEVVESVKCDDIKESDDFDKCMICGVKFTASFTREAHDREFDLEEKKEEECGRCGKKFREKRARMQHENVCFAQVEETDKQE